MALVVALLLVSGWFGEHSLSCELDFSLKICGDCSLPQENLVF